MRERPYRVALIGCSKRKRTDDPACRAEQLPAAQLYEGDLFRKALAYARATCDVAFILRAHYGLLALDNQVQHYDACLRELPPGARAAWGARVAEQLKARLEVDDSEIVCLAGETYAAALPASLRSSPGFVQPLRGLGLGRQKQWLQRQLTAAAPLPAQVRGANR